MSWFNDQIRERLKNDRNALDDSCRLLAGAVLEKWSMDRLEDQRLIAGSALDGILKYYRIKSADIPESAETLKDQLEYMLRATGLMIREVELKQGWQKKACGPMLGRMKERGDPVVFLPRRLFGYCYKDPATGRKIRVTRKNADQFEREALCFYKPLPMKKLGFRDLLLYMKDTVVPADLVLFLAAALALQLVGMIEPQVYSLVTGPILSSRNMNMLTGIAVFLLCCTFANKMIGMMKNLLMSRISIRASAAVEASVMMRILSLPAGFFRKYSSGELSNRVNCVSSLCRMILDNIFSVGLSSLLSLLYIMQIFAFAPALVIPSILIILATAAVSISASLLQIGISRKKMELAAEETGLTYSVLKGVQKIRLSGSENRTFARWAKVFARKARLEYNPPTYVKLSSVITTGISLAGTVILYYMAVKCGVSESEYYAFSAAYGRVMGAFAALAGIAGAITSVKPVLDMADPILKAEPEVSEEKQQAEDLTGRIELSNVSFRYSEDTPYILQDLNLSIRAGEYVAIAGRTGCGKSTLVRLLLAFDKPEQGTIFYDRYNQSRVDPCSLRKHFGVVTQNGQLFSGDIYSNITISAPQTTVEEAWKAAETAGIAQDIREMPMGMQTVISEGGGGISGGQKQRLMIARAIAAKPKILILDEATSALDNQTQKKVADALDGLNCTRIVIAHRLSTIRNCDRILVMNEGAIVEEGTYEELIARSGFFAELVERQRLDSFI